MKALFIGRFQPLHKGHLKIIKNASDNFLEIIIGIGSSQYKDTIDNPFTVDERKKMIENTLEKNNIKNFKIVTITDIHNPPKWVDHVLSITSDFDIVISNNSFTKRLFQEKGYEVNETPLYQKEIYSGKVIRKKIRDGEEWEDLVPTEVAKLIKKVNGLKRIRNLKEN